jgi:hypothetical protein
MATPTDAPLPPRAPEDTDTELSPPASGRGAALREGTLTEADLSDHTLSESRLTDLRLERLKGARMPWVDIVASVGTFAATLGIVSSDEA